MGKPQCRRLRPRFAPLAAIPGTLGTSKEAFKKGLDTVYASMFKVEMPLCLCVFEEDERTALLRKIREMAARSEACLSSSAPQRRS